MSLLSEILDAEKIDELYKCGFVIIERGDPFDIPAALIKPDWSYQWFTDGEHPKGWKAVAYQDHPGWFAPPDKQGLVVVKGNRLFRKLKAEVEEFHRQNKRKAEKLVEDWAEKNGAFFGGASILRTDGEEAVRTVVTAGKGVETRVETFEHPSTKTVELVSHIPKDMIPYIEEVFIERDRIRDQMVRPDHTLDPAHVLTDAFYAAIDQDKGAPWWPTLNAIILPLAIETVRGILRAAEPNSDVNVHPNRQETGNADAANGH